MPKYTRANWNPEKRVMLNEKKDNVVDYITNHIIRLTNFPDIKDGSKAYLNISNAEILVSGGRGIGSSEFLDVLNELALLIGGCISGSRATVVNGWIDITKQVGQTGNKVSPKLYLACGISGTDQHKAGMINSEFVIAINKSKWAPIFEVADIGIVGDVTTIIPGVINKLKAIKNGY